MWHILAIRSSLSFPPVPNERTPAVLLVLFLPPNTAAAASVCPAMIGGARSAKSPRDQAYIYFACFEGRTAGGC